MNDNTINLLNIEDSKIEELNCYEDNNTMIITLKLKRVVEVCPNCQSHLQKIKEYKTKKINHPILNEKKCIVYYNYRRYECKNCGRTFSESCSLVEAKKRESLYLPIVVMEKLKDCYSTFKSVAKSCNISISEAQMIFDSHYIPKRRTLSEVLSIDEVHDPATGIGVYDCILLDFKSNKIIDVLPDRTKNYLANYFTKRGREECKIVKYVIIDMWKTYKDISQLYFKNAIIAVDSFHVIKNLNDAFDKIRCTIMNRFDKNSNEYYLLKKFSFVLNKSHIKILNERKRFNRKLKRYLNYEDILQLQLEVDSELCLAYYLKQQYILFNRTATHSNAKEELFKLIHLFQKSEFTEYINFANTLLTWSTEIINSFIILDDGSRLNNGRIESRNNTIDKIIYNANGMRNFSRLRNRIMYCINDDNYSINQLDNNVKSNGAKRGKYKK